MKSKEFVDTLHNLLLLKPQSVLHNFTMIERVIVSAEYIEIELKIATKLVTGCFIDFVIFGFSHFCQYQQ